MYIYGNLTFTRSFTSSDRCKHLWYLSHHVKNILHMFLLCSQNSVGITFLTITSRCHWRVFLEIHYSKNFEISKKKTKYLKNTREGIHLYWTGTGSACICFRNEPLHNISKGFSKPKCYFLNFCRNLILYLRLKKK